MPHRIIGIVCTSPGWGGLELNTLRLCEWLREAGWKVHLMTRYGAPITQHTEQNVTTLSTFGEGAMPKKGTQLRLLHSWIRRYKIHVLFVPYNKDVAVASLYKRFYDRSVGLIYQQHMQVGVRKRDLIHTLRYAMIDVWISPLQYLKTEALRLTRVREEKIEVIPFGIEPEKFQDSNWTREAARQELSLPQDAYIIGLLGRLDPKKGQDLVVRALQQLRQHGEYHVLIMGSSTLDEGGDAYSKQLHALVRDSSLGDYVHFRTYSPDVMLFFRAIDVFAMPAHGETFGMVTLEAMAAGVTVVGTDKDGTREILGEGQYGYLFEPENVHDFIRQIHALRSDTEAKSKLRAARDTAFSQYSKKQMIDKLIPILKDLVDHPDQ